MKFWVHNKTAACDNFWDGLCPVWAPMVIRVYQSNQSFIYLPLKTVRIQIGYAILRGLCGPDYILIFSSGVNSHKKIHIRPVQFLHIASAIQMHSSVSSNNYNLFKRYLALKMRDKRTFLICIDLTTARLQVKKSVNMLQLI